MAVPSALQDNDFAPAPASSAVRNIQLDDPEQCFVVMAGEAALFAARQGEGSARLSLGKIGAGGMLFGALPSMLGEEMLLAAGSPNAQYLPLPSLGWRIPEPPSVFADAIANWLMTLSRGLGDKIEPKPHLDLVLNDMSGTFAAPANAVIGCAIGVLWIDLGSTSAQMFGMETVSGLVPLPAGAWLTLDEASELTSQSWERGLANPEWPEALDRFNAAAAELLPLVRGFAEADEFNRIRARRAAEELDAHQTVGQFGAILHNPVAPVQEAGSDGLLDVMRILGRHIGSQVERPVKSRRSQLDLAPTLDEIARASNLRLQRVWLEADWWRTESHSFLARRITGEPVALVWNRGYQEIDHTGVRRRVNRARAEGIDRGAHMVFKP